MNIHRDKGNKLFIRGLENIGQEKMTYKELYKKLEAVANEGKTIEFQDNTRRVRYRTKDEFQNFCLHWVVANAVSGRKRIFYTKDYVGETGKIKWRSLASSVRSV